MKTTMTLDDDVAAALQERAKQLDQPFRQVLNETLRRVLSLEGPTERTPPPLRAFPGGLQPGIDPTKLNQHFVELEVEAFLHKHHQ